MRLATALALVLAVALVAVAPAAARPYGFLATPTDQLAVPGDLAGFEITPEGFIYGGYGELEFRAGPKLVGLRAPVRTLEGGRYPVMRYGQRVGGVRYDLDVFAAEVAGQPVAFTRVTLRNTAKHAVRARWAVGVRYSGGALKANGVRRFRYPRPIVPERPGLIVQPGTPFATGWSYDFGDGTIVRDGQVLATFAAPPAGTAVELQPREGAGAVRPSTTFDLVEYTMRLAPGARRVLHFRMPSAPVPDGSPAALEIRAASHVTQRLALLRTWRATFDRAMALELPEQRVQEAYYANLMHILLPRYKLADGTWVQPVNKLRYHAFWLRDAAIMTQALDLAGLHAKARENLEFFGAWQSDAGQFISRAGQLDGHGQALWAIGEHIQRTGDSAFAQAMLPRLDRAVAWLRGARAADPLGLLPASDPRDNELVAGHLAGDDFWALAGLTSITAAARTLGETERAARWQAELDAMAVTVRARVSAAAARNGGAIPPVLDHGGGLDWGNLWAAWPAPVFDPRSPIVSATLAAARRNFREGLATYGEFHNLHHYLGFRVFQTELLRDEQAKVVQGLYDSLAHTTATYGGFETGVRPYARRSVDDNLAPHGWFAAELVALIRTMLVRERDTRSPGGSQGTGDGIELLSAVPGRWLAPGRATVVRNAPTTFGDVDVSLRPVRGGAVLRWDARGVPDGTPLWWRVPAGARDVRVAGIALGPGAVRLPGRAGELRIAWRLPKKTPSFDGVTAALQMAYRDRGAKPPD